MNLLCEPALRLSCHIDILALNFVGSLPSNTVALGNWEKKELSCPSWSLTVSVILNSCLKLYLQTLGQYHHPHTIHHSRCPSHLVNLPFTLAATVSLLLLQIRVVLINTLDHGDSCLSSSVSLSNTFANKKGWWCNVTPPPPWTLMSLLPHTSPLFHCCPHTNFSATTDFLMHHCSSSLGTLSRTFSRSMTLQLFLTFSILYQHTPPFFLT